MMAIGVGIDEFWKLNPRQIKIIVSAYKLKRQVTDEEAWMLGGYIFDAVSIAVGNTLKKKGQKKQEYFDLVKEPITKRISEQKDENNLTESEKKAKTELLFKNLEIMAANYRLNHGK